MAKLYQDLCFNLHQTLITNTECKLHEISTDNLYTVQLLAYLQ
jgi:hypothetical protein